MSQCKCGSVAHPLYNGRCEDCYILGVVTLHGWTRCEVASTDHSIAGRYEHLKYLGGSPLAGPYRKMLKPTLSFQRSISHAYKGG